MCLSDTLEIIAWKKYHFDTQLGEMRIHFILKCIWDAWLLFWIGFEIWKIFFTQLFQKNSTVLWEKSGTKKSTNLKIIRKYNSKFSFLSFVLALRVLKFKNHWFIINRPAYSFIIMDYGLCRWN